MVAKSYQKFEICGDPYTVNGRQYVKLSNGKQVRWYNETEYYKMYPEEKDKEPKVERIRPLKEVLGFDKGYITICKGETYPHLDWFKASDFRYSTIFGWYLCSTYEMPEDFPFDLVPLRLPWDSVAVPGEDRLLTDTAVKAAVEAVLYEPSVSEYQGSIGERLEINVKVIKTISLEGYYGLSTLHIFEDADGNIYTWNTASTSLPVDSIYNIKGRVKDHTTFRNTKQTVLTRCTYVKEETNE